ncbi:MAG: hypothetical protein ACPL88_08365, partial [Bryobacteraceae bacterium]
MSEQQPRTPSGPGYDTSEPRARTIALFGALTLVVLLAVILALQAYVDYARERQIFVKQLEPVPEDLRALRAREEAELNSYGYVDRQKGVVRIPVRRAMEL